MAGRDKFTEMVVYVADRLRDDPKGGSIKLNKVLYYSEVCQMRRHGRTITDVEYQKLQWGPAPRPLLPVRTSLINHGEAVLVSDDEELGQERLIPRREADISVFDEEELASIDAVLDWLREMPAWKVSDLSHHEPGWTLADEGATIIPEMAFLRPSVLRPEIREHATRLAQELQR